MRGESRKRLFQPSCLFPVNLLSDVLFLEERENVAEKRMPDCLIAG